jgi:ribonuclease HI
MLKQKAFILRTDGGARPNPGPASIGIEIKSPDGKSVKEISRDIGHATNNQAEYRALIVGLEELAELGAEHVNIEIDSQLVVRHINGQYRVKDKDLRPLYKNALRLLGNLVSYTIEHIPRSKNKVADSLATKALTDRKSN